MPRQLFNYWLELVDYHVQRLTEGLIGQEDLPDWDSWNMWNDGTTPLTAATRILRDAGIEI